MIMNGLLAWRLQRYSAIFLAIAVPILFWVFVTNDISSRELLIQLLQVPWIFIVLFLSLFLLSIHLWVGLRDISLDYLMGSVQTACLAFVAILLIAIEAFTLYLIYLVVSA